MTGNTDVRTLIDFADDQVAVDRPHRDLVERTLAAEFDVHVDVLADNERLNLTLLGIPRTELTGFRERIVTLPGIGQRWLAKTSETGTAGTAGDTTPPPTDLDALLFALRTHLADTFRGWIPEMGKNRDVAGVVGFPDPPSQTTHPLAFSSEGDPGVDPEIWLNGSSAASAFESPPASDQPGAGRGVRVGVLDTPLYPHPKLDGRYVTSGDDKVLIRPNPTDLMLPVAGHATLIADLICRQAPAVQLHVQWVLDHNDDEGTRTWRAASEMVTFADVGVDILNVSFGCYTADGDPPLVLKRAVEVLSPNVVIVAAAGNHGQVDTSEAESPHGVVDVRARISPRTPAWPAALEGVVAVGAHGPSGELALFSPQVPWVTCTAPGVDVTGAYVDARVKLPTHPYGLQTRGRVKWKGTSFAAATVSGAIAARTVPGRVTAREALQQLLADGDRVVKTYRYAS